MILDREVWQRHLDEDRRRDAEITKLRQDLEALDGEYDRLFSRFCDLEARFAALNGHNP